MDLIGHNPAGLGIANAFVLAALMDALVEKGVMTKAEVRKTLGQAMVPLLKSTTISVQDACRIILKMQTRFPE